MKLKNFEIVIDNPIGVFCPGEVVSAHVIVEPIEELKLRGRFSFFRFFILFYLSFFLSLFLLYIGVGRFRISGGGGGGGQDLEYWGGGGKRGGGEFPAGT